MPRSRGVEKTYNEYDPDSDMFGPYDLTSDNLDGLPDSIGVYLLAQLDLHLDDYLVTYVGRCDDRVLADRLDEHIGTRSHFYYVDVDNPEEGFLRECEEYHRYGKKWNLDNEIHPPRPAGRRDLRKCSLRGCNGEAG